MWPNMTLYTNYYIATSFFLLIAGIRNVAEGKMFASSSFYAASHPSMQEQVELARQISHSLSDDSNRLSKGQTMYVKRRNKAMKWIHEGEAPMRLPINPNSHEPNLL